MNVKVNFAGLRNYKGLQVKAREFIENPNRDSENLNFMEIITTYTESSGIDRVEYFCHSNSGCRVLTQERALEILKQWGEK